VAVLKLDSPGSKVSSENFFLHQVSYFLMTLILFKVNSLNREVMEEMKTIFDKLQTRSDVKAAVLISGKPGCFIAGADIKMLERCSCLFNINCSEKLSDLVIFLVAKVLKKQLNCQKAVKISCFK